MDDCHILLLIILHVCKYSDICKQMYPLYVLCVHVIGDIGYAFVMCRADNSDHGNKTLVLIDMEKYMI